ncbi:hypothetical protein ASZ90_001824 [hydrocarbon metagenome]|uniref:Uncharacterized protein n=1 Tax=hydrocarbon metagenome TaxID=938273 RepID=A0A0W8G567_9ZZZZ
MKNENQTHPVTFPGRCGMGLCAASREAAATRRGHFGGAM